MQIQMKVLLEVKQLQGVSGLTRSEEAEQVRERINIICYHLWPYFQGLNFFGGSSVFLKYKKEQKDINKLNNFPGPNPADLRTQNGKV